MAHQFICPRCSAPGPFRKRLIVTTEIDTAPDERGFLRIAEDSEAVEVEAVADGWRCLNCNRIVDYLESPPAE